MLLDNARQRGERHAITEGHVRKALGLGLVVLGVVVLGAQSRDRMVEWPYYGGDAGHGKYSSGRHESPPPT
jgi:hypothetical protein